MEDIVKFVQGFKRFQDAYFGDHAELFQNLAKGQNPRTAIVACSDSRVDPALLTGSAPGDIFVIRNVANLVPPCDSGEGFHGVSAALEFAVCNLEVEHVIVFGHGECGGIRSLMRGDSDAQYGGFIANWMRIAEKAKAQVLATLGDKPFELQLHACEKAAILISLDNLMSFPWIRERVAAGRLALHGWYFNLKRGKLLSYSPRSGRFEPLGLEGPHAPLPR
jgi:carbonic anhydrase